MGTVGLALEEYELMKDSKYRVYVSAVDKALKNFDYTSEWADLISALGKLNKVLLSHQKFPVIPRRIKISKRLAQCMHPALPSGVHLKALETYDIIFKCMGTNRLSHELFIYSAGLFPLLGHSAMNVRPSLLRIYETHFVPLGERLRPGLSGFLSGVLPGLEEGSDHFDRTNILLERVCEGVGASHFYGCVWDCLASNNAIRLPAISYILAHFNKKLSMEDQLHIMGTNIDVMVTALCTGVQDTSVLVQRSALDLLLVGFPMHNSQLVRGDMVRLVTAALVTILRRDMSLNRRLFAWLLGSEVNISLLSSEHPLVKRSKLNEEINGNLYFEHYSRDMLIQAIKTTLGQGWSNTPHDLRPYKLLVSLLDKPDIGPVILDDILYEVFRALYADCEGKADVKPGQKVSGSSYRGCQELLKSANLLFSTLEPFYIWQYAGVLFTNACKRLVEEPKKEQVGRAVQLVASGPPNIFEVCGLTEFLLDIVSLETYLDTPSEHLPGLFLHIITQLTQYCDTLSAHHICTSLRLAAKILSRVQPTAQSEPSKPVVEQSETKTQPSNQLELADRGRANSDLTEYKTEKAIKSKLKKSKTDSKIKKLNSNKNYTVQAESSPILLSVVYNGTLENDDSVLRRESTHFSSLNLERLSLENRAVASTTDVSVVTPPEEVNVVSIPVPTKQQTVLEECKRLYENFYVKLVGGNRRIINGNVDDMFEQLLNLLPRETNEERTTKLELLFNSCLDGTGWEMVRTNRGSGDTATGVGLRESSEGINGANKVKEWEESMRLASNLLVELSTFPSYCLPDDDPVINDDFKADGSVVLPPWLRVLLVCACWLRPAPTLQLIATSTLLDLVCLLRSQTVPGAGVGGQGVVAVVIVPLLKRWHLHFVERHTDAVEVLARSLWYHLGHSDHQHQVPCVELLHQLHQVVTSDCVEHVIGESLASDSPENRMEAFQRFATLWHIGRDLNPKAGSSQSARGFDKSLLKLLDNLQLCESCPLKLQAQSWLLHSLLRGDIARILDPLLYMLLDPATARMSVLHVSVQHSNTVVTKTRENEDNDLTAKIYAISSEDGNVIYHVQDSYKSRVKRINNNPVRAKQIFAVKTLIGRQNTHHLITERNGIDFSNPPSRNMSVFVNPCASITDVVEDDTRQGGLDFLRSVTRMSGRSSVSANSANSANSASSTSEEKSSGDNTDSMVNEKGIKFEAAQKLGNGFELGYDFDSSDSNPGYELNNFKRWSNEDLEMSTAADEFFSGDSSTGIVQSILSDILDIAVTTSESKREKTKRARTAVNNFGVGFHPLHSHMLLYCGVYDSSKILYTLRTLRSVLLTNARMFLCAAATTGIANIRNASGLIALLARHRKSVFGKSFHGDSGGVSEFGSAYRSSMYLEVLIIVCLYFARSFYPNLGQMRLTLEEIAGNRQVQLASAELLTLICAELILIVRDSGKGFSCYIADLLSRCKVQKVVLHCVFSSVYNMKTTQEPPRKVSHQQRTFTEEIFSFNDPIGETNESVPSKCKYQGSEHSEGFQVQLLRLLLALIMLEHQVNAQKGDGKEATKEPSHVSSKTSESQLRYIAGVAIPQQPMFLAAVLTALELHHTRHLHQHWTTLVTSSLPFVGPSLTHVVLKVVTQLCQNIEQLAEGYTNHISNSPKGETAMCCLPADYTVTQLEALTVLCHYCLLDSTQQQSHAFNQQLMVGAGTIPGANPGQIFNNLMHVFMPTPLSQDISTLNDKKGPSDFHLSARRTVLSNLPRIIASVSVLWHTVSSTQDWEQQNNVLGSPRVVKHQLLELLSPISLHHGVNFLAAIAVAWQERRPQTGSPRKVIPVASTGQQVLVHLVGAIRVMPIDTLVQTVHQVMKQPPVIHGATKELSLEVSALELFYCYIQSGPQLAECWGSLLGLLRDGLTLTPPAQFLMLAILNEFIQKCPPLQDKKDHRDLQDITAKLVESCTQIAGACLEQTTWLRRNLAVREDDLSVTGTKIDGPMSSLAQYSVQAQGVLAELLAPLLDVSYGSQEKERVVALLTTLMGNITPYLKNHTRRNVQSFHACSQLLASLSSYQYTRKAWRRDVFDLLLDPALFQMEANCLPYWRTIIDNLMTHDTTTFRDLMARVNVSQSNSLSIFSSREAEHEQRAQLLKRLAFVILCSETDQYHKYMPEIQERLAENLRLPQVAPSIQAQVFLCFRVLLLRMSAQHVTSLWPSIISEMVQVFLHIEQELSTDTDQFRRNNSSHIRLMSALDSSWVVNSNNGLHATGHPGWLQLQLATSKLLDVAVLLPAHQLPQFQMYRWAFVGDANVSGLNNNNRIEEDALRSSDFVPHVVRIARLMDAKYSDPPTPLCRAPGHLLLDVSSIRSLQDLHAFFLALSIQAEQSVPASVADLEAVVERDFLEKLR